MAQQKNNQLKLSSINQKAKKAHVMETHTFDDGATLKFYPEFPLTLVEVMIEEMAKILSEAGEKLKMSEKQMHQFTLYYIVKHFTALKSQFKAITLVGQINEMESLIDSGYFELIINEVFSQSEIHKVFDQMSVIGGSVVFLDKMTQKMHEEVEKMELKNLELLQSVAKKKEENIV